jgi:lipoprotein-releasing system permease protein
LNAVNALQISLYAALGLLGLLALFAAYQYLLGPAIVRKLVNRYLYKRRIAWVSLTAVMLCTALVIIVISVMGGWLANFRSAFRGMSGDIVVYRSFTGITGYEELLAGVRAMPEVDQAMPLIRSVGLAVFNGRTPEPVQVTGIDLKNFPDFNAFGKSLWRQHQEPLSRGEKLTTRPSFDLVPGMPYELLHREGDKARDWPGMILGSPLAGGKKDRDNKITFPATLYENWVRLEVIPIASDTTSLTRTTPSATAYWIVDASRSQLYQIDAVSAYVPFDVLQRDLEMTATTYTETDTGKKVTVPARCSEVQIRLHPDADRAAVMNKVRPLAEAIDAKYEPGAMRPIRVEGWEEQQQTFLSAVENEKSLVTFLLGLISLVAVFLIFCILYMIVVEKTRDIGIIKSVGATAQGVAGIFVAYGLAIGVVGSLLGVVLAALVVTYINQIHTWLGQTFGLVIWNPETYAFDTIPNDIDPPTVAVIAAIAVLSAVVGALVPAVRAGHLNPVEALRFE